MSKEITYILYTIVAIVVILKYFLMIFKVVCRLRFRKLLNRLGSFLRSFDGFILFYLQIEVQDGFRLFFLYPFNKNPLNNVVFFACSLTTDKIEFSSFKKASNRTWVISWAHTHAHKHTHTPTSSMFIPLHWSRITSRSLAAWHSGSSPGSPYKKKLLVEKFRHL